MLNWPLIPPRAHTYLADLGLILRGLVPVAFLTLLPGTFMTVGSTQNMSSDCSKVAQMLPQRLKQASELSFHITATSSNPFNHQHEDLAF